VHTDNKRSEIRDKQFPFYRRQCRQRRYRYLCGGSAYSLSGAVRCLPWHLIVSCQIYKWSFHSCLSGLFPAISL